jgi:hypothetical protein
MKKITRSQTTATAALNKAAAASTQSSNETKQSSKRKSRAKSKEITLEELEDLDQEAAVIIDQDIAIEKATVGEIKTFFNQDKFETILQNMSTNIPLDWLDTEITDPWKNEALGYYFNQRYPFQGPVTERVLIEMELNEAVQVLFDTQSGEATIVSLTDPQKDFIGSAIAFYRYYKNVSNDIIRDPQIIGDLLSFLKIMYTTISMFQASKELDDELRVSAKERNTGGYELVRYVDPKAIFSIQGQEPFVVVQPFTRNFEDTSLGRQINSFNEDGTYIDPQKPFNMIKSNIIINTSLALALNKFLLFKTPSASFDYNYNNSIKVFMGIGYKTDANWKNFDLDRVFHSVFEATGMDIDELLKGWVSIQSNLIFSSETAGGEPIIIDNVSPLASSSYDYNVALKFVKRPSIIYGVVISIIYGPNMKFFAASNSANEKEVIVLPCRLQLSKIFIDKDNHVVIFELSIIEELTTVVLKTNWDTVINGQLLPHIKKMYKGKKKKDKEILSSQNYDSQDPNFFSDLLVASENTAGGSKPKRKTKSNRKTKRISKTNKKRRTKRRNNKRRTNKRRRI